MMNENNSNNNPGTQTPASRRFSPFVSEHNLKLTRQRLTDKDIPDLIEFLQSHPSIQKLDLSLNDIGNKGLSLLVENNETVIQINLTGNNITDHGLEDFALKNQHIIEANFSHNMITDQGIEIYANINRTCYSSQFSKMRFH